MPCLVYTPAGTKTSRSFPLFKKVTSVGSGEDNDIHIKHPDLAETHALIHFDGQGFNVQQAGRKCELIVNGKKRRKIRLSHRDELKMGAITFSFLLYDEPKNAQPEEAIVRLEAYQKLHAFSVELSRKYKVPELLESLMDHVIALSEADKGFLLLQDNGKFEIKVARNMKRETILDAEGQLSDSIINKVIKSKRPVIVSDALNDREFNNSRSVMHLKLCSVMCVPLLDRGTMMGAIYVGNDNVVNLFEMKHLDLLSIFASQASLIVSNAILVNDLQLINRELRSKLDEKRFGSIIGTCGVMRAVFSKVQKVASTDITVLIEGETGTGKELIAHELHNFSSRNKGPFITINCGAIPETLLESELFGHVRGAFTGATNTRSGKFQLADGGTLFLDEIGEMPLNLQVKLLRVLQEREVTKVGGGRSESINIRVVAATNKNLEKEVQAGRFREDLFYRLNVVTLLLPPLRDRGDDVLLIARFLIKKFCKDFNLPSKGIAPESAIAMRKYRWPGNIRQLENRLKKALILSEGAMLTPDDLDLIPEILTEIKPLSEAKEQFQRRYINEILELNGGNRTKTARDLGVDPRTIFRHLEKEADRNSA